MYKDMSSPRPASDDDLFVNTRLKWLEMDKRSYELRPLGDSEQP